MAVSAFILLTVLLFVLIQFASCKDNFPKNSTTFKVCDKIPEKYNYHEEEKPDSNRNLLLDTVRTKEIVSELNQYKKNNCTEYLHGTTFSSRSQPSPNNGFVNTVVESYNNHHNLIIRPDDVWLQIMVQFSFYINANAEEFRSKFVDFKGKKDLIVSLPGSLRSAPYDMFIKLMSQKIHENILDKKFKSWIQPNFTTTTDEDEVTSGVVFMATMKKYFSYGFNLLCGIPSVTLEGTVEDWLEILSRLEKLKQYKLRKWYDLLEPVLQQFVAAKRGNPDLDFWKRIVHQSGGSGPPKISGWITVFCVFDFEGKWQAIFYSREGYGTNSYLTQFLNSYSTWPVIDMDAIPSGIAEVDVTIIDAERNYSSVLFGGHMAFEVLDDETTLKPLIGWALALTNNHPDPVNSADNKNTKNLSDGLTENSREEHQRCELDGSCQSSVACNSVVELCDFQTESELIGVAASCSISFSGRSTLAFSLLIILIRMHIL